MIAHLNKVAELLCVSRAASEKRPHPFPPEAGERVGHPKSFSEFKAAPLVRSSRGSYYRKCYKP